MRCKESLVKLATITLSILLYLNTPVWSGNIPFSDDFEGQDPVTLNGWEGSYGVLGVKSSDQTFSGSQSVKLNNDSSLLQTFDNLDFGGELVVSVRFYDSMHTGNNHEKWVRLFFDDNKKSTILQAYNNSTNFQPNYLADFYHQEGGIYDYNNNTGVARSLGWHEFRFVVENNNLDLYIDGQQVMNDVLTVSTLNRLELHVGETGPGYFDAISVTSSSSSKIEKILFASNKGMDGRHHLWMMNPDGSEQEQLTFDSNYQDFRPRISPDGARILFERSPGDDPDHLSLWMLEIGNDTPIKINLDTSLSHFFPTWGPTGQKIAFCTNTPNPIPGTGAVPQTTRLFMVELEGAPSYQIIGTPQQFGPNVDCLFPSWSKDGKYIAFSKRVSGYAPYEVWRHHVDSGVDERVIPYVRGEYLPVISPDSKLLAWASARSGSFEVYVKDLVTGTVDQLTSSGGVGTSQPIWSPNGERLIVVSQSDLWIMDKNGSNLTSVPVGSSNETMPEWGFILGESPNQPPVPDIAQLDPVECTGASGTPIQLYGSDSSDPDGDEIDFLWTAEGVTFDDATSPTPIGIFPMGTTVVTLTLSDGINDPVSARVSAVVQDTTPPELSVSVTPDVLWPPNHKLLDILASWTVSDVCDENPSVTLVSIESNEPDAGIGEDDVPGDIHGAELSTDDNAFQLRAERGDDGDGRIYTVTYQAEDASGNTVQASVEVVVPKNQAGGKGKGKAKKPALVFGAENFPNPANPSTTIRYGLPENEEVSLVIFNLLGQEVRTLVRGSQSAGLHLVEWDGKDALGREVTSGVYLYQLTAGRQTLVKKMMLLK